MDSFVFYESFHKVTESFDDHKFARVMRALYRKGLYGTEPDLEDETENSLVNMMAVNIKAAHDRYDKAKADGATGGRPGIKVAPEEWQAYRDEHTQKETADHFGISIDTLQRWEKKTGYRKTAKPQNLTVTDTDTVTVTATDTDTVTSICINKNNKGESDASALTGIVLPNIREGCRWVGEPYILASGRWACHYEDEHGEERTMVL